MPAIQALPRPRSGASCDTMPLRRATGSIPSVSIWERNRWCSPLSMFANALAPIIVPVVFRSVQSSFRFVHKLALLNTKALTQGKLTD